MSKLIPLHGKYGKGKFAIVDDENFEHLNQYVWHAAAIYSYAVRWTYIDGKRILLYMHCEVLSRKQGHVIDHINHDTLDNRKQNLRYATISENCLNSRSRKGTSIYKGVSWRKDIQKWNARITLNGRDKHLGFFSSETEAARVFDAAARIHHGEFAVLNFP